MKYSEEFLKAVPKSDLHLHLDGSLRLATLIELAQQEKIELPSYTEAGLKELVFKDSYGNLGEYLHGFMYTCAVLRSAENLERCAYELAIDNQNEGVRYIEVRFAPQLHMDNMGMTMEVILESVNNGLKRAEQEFNSRETVQNGEEPPFHYGIIACAMRMFGKSNFSPYYTRLYSVHKYMPDKEVIKLGALELARAIVRIRDEKGIPIVALDLAGQEHGYPAEYFKDAYDFAHRNFMGKTVHAGEAYGAESIFQAITQTHADRLGHCYSLFDHNKIVDPDIKDKEKYTESLSSFIADSRIGVEVCLTSNMQTNPELKDLTTHAFGKMLEKRLAVSICTDNRLVSNTTVTKELKLATDHFEVTPRVLKDLLAYGFTKSFFPGPYHEKRVYSKRVMNYYDKVAKAHGVEFA